MKKNSYEAPEIDIARFDVADVITASAAILTTEGDLVGTIDAETVELFK